MLRIGTKIAVAAAAFAAAAVGLAAPAAAQATRTWVSGVGDDANPCSRTAPCKTFAGSISKTAAGGEINCLDPGGFGAVTITKSITIDCEGAVAGVLSGPNTNAITVNAGATDQVVLRGLDFEGLGNTSTLPAYNAVSFVAGASLVVDKSIIRNFTGNAGIFFQPNTTATLTITDTSIINSGSISRAAVLITPSPAAGAVTALIENTKIIRTPNIGLQVTSVNATAGIRTIVVVKNSDISGGGYGATAIVPPGTRNVQLSIVNSVISNNAGYGVAANGAGAQARISNSLITGNATGISTNNGGAVLSHGGNAIYANTTDGTFTATFPQQ